MTTERTFDPRRLDVAAFATSSGSLSGEWPLGGLSRLATASPYMAEVADRPVSWTASGGRAVLANAGVQPTLHLGVDTTVRLECQRCLQALDLPVHVDRRLFFVEGDEAAAALDEDSEEDVLALEPSVELRSLVEDELLLALPIVPRHEVCPEPLVQPEAAEEAAAENPFAVLAALKRPAEPN